MTALIWMITWLLQLLPAMSELPHPVNVTLTSENFIHLLKWEPGPGTPLGVHYRVSMYTTTVMSWQPVDSCQNVQRPLVCNLTQAFSDRSDGYFIQVKAMLDTQASKEVPLYSYQFTPLKDTHLDLPLLNVTACGEDLCVDLQPPREDLRSVYKSLHYKLRIQCNSVEREQDFVSLRREILENLAPGREYCVSVCFSDTKVPRTSNYSKPVCVSTPSKFNADPWIVGVLCSMVLFGLVFLILLFFAGFFCLFGRPLPHNLTSVRHLEGVVVITPHTPFLSSVLNVKTTAPSAGVKRGSQTSSDESDGESQTEDTGGSRGGGDYKLRVGTNLLSSSSSSSSSLSSVSAPLSPQPGATATSSDSVSPQLVNLTVSTGLNDGPSSHPDSLPESDPPADCWTGGGNKEEEEKEEEKEEEEEGGSRDVNLLTLTFGRQEEEEEKEESHMESSCPSEVFSTTPLLPARTWDAEEVVIETVPSSVNEEEEEEDDSGYMRR